MKGRSTASLSLLSGLLSARISVSLKMMVVFFPTKVLLFFLVFNRFKGLLIDSSCSCYTKYLFVAALKGWSVIEGMEGLSVYQLSSEDVSGCWSLQEEP